MDKYKYSYEKTANYCYRDSDVLINNLNIMKDVDLYKAERELVAIRTAELSNEPIKGNFDFEHLKSIHKFLFQDVYRWAGEIRTCNIAKQDWFCLSDYIETFANDIFNKLRTEKFYTIYDYDIKISKLVELFADINALHPFREGNGRCQREFIEELAKINGINLDLTPVSKMDMVVASHESIRGDYDKLNIIFRQHSVSLFQEDKTKYISLYCNETIKHEIQN